MIRQALVIFFMLLLLASCRSGQDTPAGAQPEGGAARTPTPTPANDEEAILQLLRAESEGVVQQDMERLAEIWAEDATVTDAKHTPDDPGDDAEWRGIDAILDRYVVLVFPGNPQYAEPADVTIVVDGDTATATSTTRIGDEVSPGGDRWTFVRRDGRWYILGLVYNLEESD